MVRHCQSTATTMLSTARWSTQCKDGPQSGLHGGQLGNTAGRQCTRPSQSHPATGSVQRPQHGFAVASLGIVRDDDAAGQRVEMDRAHGARLV
jgi:hypothetical protein